VQGMADFLNRLRFVVDEYDQEANDD
jgi:hypothetical protein